MKNISSFKERIKRDIKGIMIFRFLMYPFMSILKKRQYIDYAQSEDSMKMKKLKESEKGNRCFIIGNGSSLRTEDLELLKDEVTFASNRIYNIFDKTSWRPKYYMAEDTDGLSEMAPCVLNQGIPYIILNEQAKKYINNTCDFIYWGHWSDGHYIINRYNDKSIHISEDVSMYFSIGYTVTFSAIQLAIYMGVREIYLLGVDFNYSVYSDKWGRKKTKKGVITYFDGKERHGSYLNYHSTMRAYQKAKEYCDKHGIRIANATRGGCLEVFERQDFDKLMGVNP